MEKLFQKKKNLIEKEKNEFKMTQNKTFKITQEIDEFIKIKEEKQFIKNTFEQDKNMSLDFIEGIKLEVNKIKGVFEIMQNVRMRENLLQQEKFKKERD